MRNVWLLFFCCVFLPVAAQAQGLRHGQSPWRYPYTYQGDKTKAIAAPIEVSLSYNYVRSNVVLRSNVVSDNSFNMNGGSTEVAFHTYRWFSAVADLTGAHSGSINGGPQGLSLVAFTAGPRFTYPVHHRYAPFVQTLVGAAHGFESYFPVSSGATGAANGFAMLAGGGLDIRTKSWLAIRPIQADYFLTKLPNGSNDLQNNLRISAGLVLRIW